MPTDFQLASPDAMATNPSEPTSEFRERTEDATFLSSQRAAVKRWQGRVVDAKQKYKADFDQMRLNMDFVANYQWSGQTKRNDKRYKANFILRLVKQKVATLYAKNPKVEFVRKKRLDFALWDGEQESLLNAMQQSAMIVAAGGIAPPEAMMLLEDWQNGQHWRKLIEHYGTTLSYLYEHQIDIQEPEYKCQAKDCVDRTCVCGVSYARINYCSYREKTVSKSEEQPTEQDRIAHAKELLRQVDSGEVEMDSAQVDTLRSIVSAIGGETQENDEQTDHLVFDFPPATTIIPDPKCRRLKGFIGAHWVAQEYVLPVEFINAFFGVKIDGGASSYCPYSERGFKDEGPMPTEADKEKGKDPMGCVWEIIDKDTKSRFFICDGYKDYLLPPEVVVQVGKVFWPWFPLVFNAVETEKGCKATVFPPSDVELGMPQQREWNRAREEWTKQRKGNLPKYIYAKGMTEVTDVENLVNAESNQCLGVNPPANGRLEDILVALKPAPVDPSIYDTNPVKEDLLLSTGAQEANIGPAQPNVTATNSQIAEQSRTNVAASNVDDLEEWLSSQAYYGGGLLAKFMPREQVMEIVGPGSVWPSVDQDIFANEIFLKTVAGSSGKPNQAIELAKRTQIAPLMLQAGANPRAIIRWLAQAADLDVDESEFYPVVPPPLPGAGAGPQGESGSSPQGQTGNGQGNEQPNQPGQGQPQGRGQMNPKQVKPVANGTAEVAA